MYKSIFSFLCVFLVGTILPSQAQITVNSSGDAFFDEDVTINGSIIMDETIKIGNPNASYYKVAVECDNSCGSFIRYGMHITTNGSSDYQHYGIYSRAIGSSSNHYGVRGYASGGSSLNRGIVGAASGSSSYGGYFTSGIYVSGGLHKHQMNG